MNRQQKKSPKKKGKSAPSDKKKQEKEEEKRDPAEVRASVYRVAAQRETVEAFVVAFILALLFRAFLAEAFVIPTGSMAPTLMGAHKDIVCDRCQTSYQCGASVERRGPTTEGVVVATVCPNCRHTNPLDLVNKSNDGTFNGDRILVSKFSYTLKEPERWDVIVFKFPGNPKQNYIKRLVGLPNETLTIRHGDMYARPTGSEQNQSVILRKPPEKLLAMRHPVYDTDYQSPEMIRADYPSRWQPWAENASTPPTDSWKINRSEDGFTATLDEVGTDSLQWLRYYHRWADDDQWERAAQGLSLADVDPYSSRLISDFYSYNAYVNVDARRVYARGQNPATFRGSWFERLLNGGYSTGTFRPEYQSGEGPQQFGLGAGYGNYNLARDGMHWVGDLIIEADVSTSSDSRDLMLELVEAGVKYRCSVDLASGTATLSMVDGETELLFEESQGQPGTAKRQAQTSLRAGQRHDVRFSNCDDQLLLWVDDKVVAFDGPTTFDSRLFRTNAKNYPRYSASHPLDAAPAAIAVRGGTSTVHRLCVDRDKYYIATDTSADALNDYDDEKLWELVRGGISEKKIQDVFNQREEWETFVGWQGRRVVEFELLEDQFFPMGDNSPESLDARCWANTKARLRLPGDVNKEAYKWTDASYVPRDLLVGKALVVFWPHSWNSPVPFIPNVKRMKLIR